MGRTRLDSNVTTVGRRGRLETSFDSFSDGVGQLRADSVLLGHQRLTKDTGPSQNGNGGTSVSKVHQASVALQNGDADDTGDAWLGCSGCLPGAGGYGGASRSTSAAGRAQQLSAERRGKAHPNGGRQEDDEDSGYDQDDDPQALSAVFRSLRSGLVGWGCRLRLRLLGGSSRMVMVDGKACSLRKHLKLHKPKRSALRGGAAHSLSCPGCLEHGAGQSFSPATPASPISAFGAWSQLSPAIAIPSSSPKKKLRFFGLDSLNGPGMEAPDAASENDSAGKAAETIAGGGSSGGGSGSGGGAVISGAVALSGTALQYRSARGGFGDGDAGLIVVEGPDALGHELVDAPSEDEAAAAAAQSPPTPPRPPLQQQQTARDPSPLAMAERTADTVRSAPIPGTGNNGTAAAAADAIAANGTGSTSGDGSWRQSSSRKLLLRGSPGGRGVQVHPLTSRRDAAACGSPQAGGPGSGRSGASGTTADIAAAPTCNDGGAPLSVVGSTPGPADVAAGAGAATGGTAALASRPPSLLVRLLLGARDSGASSVGSGGGSNTALAHPQQRFSLSRASNASSVAGDATPVPANSSHVRAANPEDACSSAKPAPPAAAPPPPGRHLSAQVLRNALFEPSGGSFVHPPTRSTSYTSPGMIITNAYDTCNADVATSLGGGGGGDGGTGAAGVIALPAATGSKSALQLPARRLFLSPPQSNSPDPHEQVGIQQQQQQRRRRQLMEEGPLHRNRSPTTQQQGGEEADARKNPERKAEMDGTGNRTGYCEGQRLWPSGQQPQSAQQSWVTSVRPVGDDVGDDVVGDGTRPFDWLEALRKSRSATERWSRWKVTATEIGRQRGDDGDDGDAVDLLQRLGRGNSLLQPTRPAAAPVVRAGRSGAAPAVLEVSFSNLSFTVQQAIHAVRENNAARGSGGGRQIQPHMQNSELGEPSRRQAGMASPARITSPSDAAFAASTERSRRIRAAPFATALGLLQPFTPPAPAPPPSAAKSSPLLPGAHASSSARSRHGRGRQYPQATEAAPGPPSLPPRLSQSAIEQPSQNARRSFLAAAGSLSPAVGAPAVDDVATTPSACTASGITTDLMSLIGSGHSSAAVPRGLLLVSPSPPSSEHPSPSAACPGIAAATNAAALAAAAAVVAAPAPPTCSAPMAENRFDVPGSRQVSSCEALLGWGGVTGGCGCPSRQSEPSLTYPEGAEVRPCPVESGELIGHPDRTSDSDVMAAASCAAASLVAAAGGSQLASPLGLRPPLRSRMAAGSATPPEQLSAGGQLAMASLNTPTASPWVDERTALAAGSGTPFADMTSNLAQMLAARLEMTRSGLSSADRAARAAQSSQIRSAPFNAAIGLLQEQQRLHLLRTSAGAPGGGNTRVLPTIHASPATDCSTDAVGELESMQDGGHGAGGGGGGSNVAARAEAVLKALKAAPPPTLTATQAVKSDDGAESLSAAGSGGDGGSNAGGGIRSGGGGGIRSGGGSGIGSGLNHGFQLPGGIESMEGVAGRCAGGAAPGGGADGGGAVNGITSGGAVLSNKHSIVERCGASDG